jgi:hypothetical protein
MFGYRPTMDVKFIKILLYHGYSLEKCVDFKIDFGLLDRLSINWVNLKPKPITSNIKQVVQSGIGFYVFRCPNSSLELTTKACD